MLSNHGLFLHALISDDFANSLTGTDLGTAEVFGALLGQDFFEERSIAD